jgi:hypothetical protein
VCEDDGWAPGVVTIDPGEGKTVETPGGCRVFDKDKGYVGCLKNEAKWGRERHFVSNVDRGVPLAECNF